MHLREKTLLSVFLGFALLGAMPSQAAREKVIPASSEDVARIQEEVWKLKKGQAELKEQMAQILALLEERCGGTAQSNARLAAKLDEVTSEILVLSEKLSDANYRLALAGSHRPAAPAAPAPILEKPAQAALPTDWPAGLATSESGEPPSPQKEEQVSPQKETAGAEPPVPPPMSPEQAYQAAYADYTKGNFSLAVMGFEKFVKQDSQNDLADNALYWVGECHYAQRQFEEAIGVFDRVLEKYPEGDKIPAVLLKKGYAYMELYQIGQGVVVLQSLIQRHPHAPEARLAKQKLDELGMGR
ncbi:MAG: tol-pal system protein YbgF [Acidobacteriota bacterium]|nr:MAG: tol-pal system protein YbgF [Acidobacteriota bacterium]